LDNQEFRDTLDTIINISEKLYLPPIQTTWTWIHKS